MSKMTTEERERIPEADFAGPHRSFPIRNQEDVNDAARLIGHADDTDAVKKKILKLCKDKGLDPPKTWVEHSASHK